MAIRLLIADDHAVVRKGIRLLLEDESDIQIVGEASDGDEAIDLVNSLQPDVLLLDITMPRMSGIEVLKSLGQQPSSLHTLIFSMHSNPDYILKAVQHGAAGYLQKDTSQEEILQAIHAVMGGELYYPPSASTIIIRELVLGAAPAPGGPDGQHQPSAVSIWNKITSREAQVLTCLIEGMSSAEIAAQFGSSANTVANQRASIIRKAGVKNTADLIRLALSEPMPRPLN
ncbi:two component transcriptional regulator, LuxR family [Fibrella aestuarina BUZ 2]|uniref:Two component transcriptional regulator, LuxR family n=1 Tax=Fibrella aestuarina BUZ 2 TaxID=1166018 RepID=I0KDX6_9BACT|nr:response regulator transcription factor [Fibrella aestuarina]CCH02329.1 two component transcriptional regulator, LuxR family [Fibrella aestuarina BUZ 2]